MLVSAHPASLSSALYPQVILMPGSVVPVHCFGGTWGLLAVGLLAHPTRILHAYGTDAHPGFLYSLASSADANLLGCQFIGILFVIGWTMFTMVPFFIWLYVQINALLAGDPLMPCPVLISP